MDGFLGTNASFNADLTLIIYILLLAPAMIAGFVFARQKKFVPHHKLVMTGIVIFNWVLILWLMATSYAVGVAPSLSENITQPWVLLPTIHLITGGLAQVIATYLVLLMWTEKTAVAWVLPDALRIKNIKLPMRLTLTLWLITVVLGIGIYLTWYTGASTAETPAPVTTEEAPADTGAPATTEEAPADTGAPATTEEAPGTSADEDESAPAPAATEDAG